MEALCRKKRLGGTSMTAQEMPIRHDPQTPPANSTTKRVFIGPNGLRAGWRLLIFMAIVMAMSAVARVIIGRFFPAALAPVQLTPMIIIVPDLLVCFILAVAAWIMSRIGNCLRSCPNNRGPSYGAFYGIVAPIRTILIWLFYLLAADVSANQLTPNLDDHNLELWNRELQRISR
jgi:hypothetical protein